MMVWDAVDKYVASNEESAQKTTEALITQYGKLLAKKNDVDGTRRNAVV